MITRTTAELLRILSEEVGELAQIAEAFDHAVGQLALTQVQAKEITQLQRVDTLQQHLSDVSVALSTIVTLIEPGPALDMRKVTANVRLDDLRCRLAGGRTTGAAICDTGSVQLF